MTHTIRKNAREWQRLWRGGEIITETHGDDPGMPRRAPRKRTALARPSVFEAGNQRPARSRADNRHRPGGRRRAIFLVTVEEMSTIFRRNPS